MILKMKFLKRAYTMKSFRFLGIKIKYKSKLKEDISEFENVLCVNKECVDKKIENLKINRKKCIPNLVVSMTSYPERMKDIHYAIYSVFNQSVLPDKFILWLAESEFPNKELDIPSTVLQFKRYGLEIRFTDAIRSFKKLCPALQEFPKSILVSADDDIYYPNTWLEDMYKTYKNSPTMICAHRIHKVKVINGEIGAYDSWDKCIIDNKGSFYNFPTSVGGVLYPPNSLYFDSIKKDLFLKLCPHQDDVWVWAMAITNNVKIRSALNAMNNSLVYVNPERELSLNGETTLAQINIQKGENDKQIKSVVEYYNILRILGKTKC